MTERKVLGINIQPDKIDTLKKLLLSICVSQPLELSVDKPAVTAGITKATLYKYIDYLGRAELIHHISHEAKRFSAMRKPDKLYLGNTNLFSALCMEREKGTLAETYAACKGCRQKAPPDMLSISDSGNETIFRGTG